MIVTCDSCHKTFSYEKYDGFCPKCGAYVSGTYSLEKNIILHTGNGSDLSGTRARRVRTESMARTRQARRMDEQSHNHTGRKVGIALVVIFLLFAVFYLVGEDVRDENTGSWDLEAGETIEGSQFSIRFEEALIVGENSKGQLVLKVPYFTDCDWMETGYRPYEVAQIYVCVDGGLYTDPAFVDDALIKSLYRQSDLAQAWNGMMEQEGALYFWIPAEFETLDVYLVMYEDAFQEDLEDTFTIPLEVAR